MAPCTIIEANLLQLCTRLHTSSNRSLQFENEITQVLPCDSTIEATESSIVTIGYGIKLVILGVTWEIYLEHGGVHSELDLNTFKTWSEFVSEL